jgi:hypothetical protein
MKWRQRMGDMNNSNNDNQSNDVNNALDMNQNDDFTQTSDASDNIDTYESLGTADSEVVNETVDAENQTSDQSNYNEDVNFNMNTETTSDMNPLDYSQPEATQTYLEVPKKKVSGKFVALLVVIGVIIVGSVTAFMNRNALANTISRMTKSPTEYYAYVEQKGLNNGIDKLTKSYDKAAQKYNDQISTGVAQDSNFKFTISPEFASMANLGSFKSVEAVISSLTKEGNSKTSLGLSYNGTSLISSDIFVNAETSDMYLLVPELSSAYLLFSIDEIMAESGAYPEGFSYSKYMKDIQSLLKDDSLSAETLNTLLKKYSAILINNIKNVTIEDSSTLKASDISNSFTTLRAEITNEDAYNMAMAILNEAKKDQTLKDLCKSLEICTEEEYTTAIDDSINELTENKKSMSSEEPIFMNVYVDKNGKILGREFTTTLDDVEDSLGYYITKKGNDFGFTSWYSEGKTKVFDITGKATVKNNSYTGKCTLSFSNFNDTYEDTATSSFDIAFENVGIVKDKGYINGKYTITSDLLAGMELVLDCTADQEQQKIIFKMVYGNLEAATLEFTGKESAFKDFSMPSDSEQIIDGVEDMDSYLETVDYEGFITKLEGALGIEDLDSYLGYLLPGLTY